MSTSEDFFAHETADVASTAIGNGTRIWQYVVVLKGAQIGANCNICSHCFIENDVIIGNGVTVKSGVQLWDGVRIDDDVFIGPNVSFTNDRYPRSRNSDFVPEKTIIESRVSIGAGAVILPGLTIGAGAMVGAGAVVVGDVPQGAVVIGNPARVAGEAKHAPE